MSKRDDETIILGSGNLHYTEFNGTLPSLEDIFKEETIVGAIQGGASIEYKPSFYEAKDDSGKLVKTILTDEEATLKTGIKLYKVIGAEQGKSWRAVEGQIRTAAKTAWRTNSQSLANMAGYPLTKPPTPSEFIAILHYYTQENSSD